MFSPTAIHPLLHFRLDAADQMEYATQMLSGYRERPDNGALLTRHDYIIYQIENHILRTGMVFDRALRTVNVVFDLGIPPRECKFAAVAKNYHVASTPVCDELTALQNILQPLQADRNRIAHRETYVDDDLYNVGLCSCLQKSSPAANDDHVVEVARNMAKPIADKYVQTKKAELVGVNASVFTGVHSLLESLTAHYNRRLYSLHSVR